MRGLSGKIAMVTGATGLIGGAVVHRLAAEGAMVIVASRQLEKAQQWIEDQTGINQENLIPLEINLEEENSINNAFAQLKSMEKLPTILIANASQRDGVDVTFEDLSHAGFNKLFEVDVAGHFIAARKMVDELPPETSANIVFLSSIYALSGVDPSIYPEGMLQTPIQYAAVKAGGLGMIRFLAGKWGHRGIRVNAIVSGGVRASDRQENEFLRNYNRKTMLGRMAKPHEVASSVAFLASEEASYITGASLSVDGGWLAW